jgi:hypothetical protein
MSEYDDSHMLSKTLERIAAQAKHLKEKIDLGLEIPSWAEYKVYSAYDGIGKALGTSYPGSYGEAKKEASGYLSKGLGGAAAGALTGAGAGALSDKDNRLRGAAIGAAGGGVLGAGAGLITGKMLKAQRAAIAEGTATESDSLKKVYNALDSRAAPASLVSGVGGGLIGTQMAADYRDKNRARFRKEAGVHVGGGGLQTAATKTDPQKWEQAKAEARAKMGGKHSARAMQLATKIYKDKGGGYSGAKPSASNNSLKKWTKQDWNWTGGDKPGEGGRGVYLPKQKADRLRQTEEGKDRLAKAARQKREATRQGEQYSSHGLAKGTS